VKKIAIILGLALLVAGTASAQTVVGSKHDMSVIAGGGGATAPYNGQVCVYCHTPHGAATGAALWNRTLPAAGSFTGAEAAMTYINSGASASCLSCHDGTVGVDNVINVGGAAGNWADGTAGTKFNADWSMATTNPAYIGTDLSNDHPIGYDYPVALGGTNSRFKTPVTYRTGVLGLTVGSTTTKLPIYDRAGAAYTVECSSCHTPHSNANTFFLRAANTGSQICLACHIK
jgi:predicted CXXCH cytochrome family protein